MTTDDEKRKARAKKIKDYTVYTLIGVIGVIFLCFIFSSMFSSNDGSTDDGLNNKLPDAEEDVLPTDKKSAYEMLELENFNDDLSFDEEMAQPLEEVMDIKKSTPEEDLKTAKKNAFLAITGAATTPQRSDEAEAKSKENERLRHQIAVLNDSLSAKRSALRVAETANKMYDMALRGQASYTASDPAVKEETFKEESSVETKEEEVATVMPVTTVRGVATSLRSNGSSSVVGGFYGIGSHVAQKNTIKASVYGRQTVGEGQNVRLRLSEPMMVAGQVMPVGSILVGYCAIGVDRLYVSVSSVEYQDVITIVDLDVYDLDGQRGIFLPGSAEMDATREIGVDVARAVGSTTSTNPALFNQNSAAEQLKTDVGRGVIQGTFNYMSKKLAENKVTLQDKHKIYLLPKR
ncbi:MAG: conjugative transposon protein TraM [Prevotellaceae bacterium]|jgi:conjugative transposon TraM protein|nr:conjugative transposon protein TraM [Prevotellaceae bacterium]